jgi:hypothetical protein
VKKIAAKGGDQTYMDADFWYFKGVVMNKKKGSNAEDALKCYKQAYALDSKHTPSIFNLGCSY